MLEIVDHPELEHTIVLITGDKDYAYLISSLRLRHRTVILVAPRQAVHSLKSTASLLLFWEAILQDREAEDDNSLQSSSGLETIVDLSVAGPSSQRDPRQFTLAGCSENKGTNATSDKDPAATTTTLEPRALNAAFLPLVETIKKLAPQKRKAPKVEETLIARHPTIYCATHTSGWLELMAEAENRGIVKDRGPNCDIRLGKYGLNPPIWHIIYHACKALPTSVFTKPILSESQNQEAGMCLM
jgi:hypothetical protein